MSQIRLAAGKGANDRLALLTLVVILVPMSVAVFESGGALLVNIFLATALTVSWQLGFALLRQTALGVDALAPALALILLAPPAAPIWQVALALSFGLVLGDLIFGGRGRGFLSPATIGLAFLLFSFSHYEPVRFGPATTFAAMASGIGLLAFGVLSWRIMAGSTIALIAIAQPWVEPVTAFSTIDATLVLGLVFLVGDPFAAASTHAGRWFYGSLAGGLTGVFLGAGNSALSSVVFGALLASIFAPLLDQIVIWANARRREQRYGDG